MKEENIEVKEKKGEKEKDEKEEEVSVAESLYRFVTDNFTKKHLLLVLAVISLELLQVFNNWWLGSWTKN